MPNRPISYTQTYMFINWYSVFDNIILKFLEYISDTHGRLSKIDIRLYVQSHRDRRQWGRKN